MTSDPRSPVVIVGRLLSKANRKGRAEFSYLNTRTQDGRVTIHDPQESTATKGENEDLMNHVNNDECKEYVTVNLEKLIQIIIYFSPIWN